jgi:hypothetical protein
MFDEILAVSKRQRRDAEYGRDRRQNDVEQQEDEIDRLKVIRPVKHRIPDEDRTRDIDNEEATCRNSRSDHYTLVSFPFALNNQTPTDGY